MKGKVKERERRGGSTYAALPSLTPHSSATLSKSGVSLVGEFLMQEIRTCRSASLSWGAMVRRLMVRGEVERLMADL